MPKLNSDVEAHSNSCVTVVRRSVFRLTAVKCERSDLSVLDSVRVAEFAVTSETFFAVRESVLRLIE